MKLSVALCLLALALFVFAMIVLKVVYEGKAHRPLPAKKPALCWLPKFVFSLPLDGRGSLADELVSRLEDYGFDVANRDAKRITFSRGSALGEFSIAIAKLNATASLPLSNPVEVRIEYGVALGCVCDTGDLWKFCRELIKRSRAATLAASGLRREIPINRRRPERLAAGGSPAKQSPTHQRCSISWPSPPEYYQCCCRSIRRSVWSVHTTLRSDRTGLPTTNCWSLLYRFSVGCKRFCRRDNIASRRYAVSNTSRGRGGSGLPLLLAPIPGSPKKAEFRV